MVGRDFHKGFTIVELLIVIVVIAILAAITIVSYNGIVTNARNTTRIDAANTVAKSLRLYASATSKEQLRSLLIEQDQCIGVAYEDVDPSAAHSCRYAEYASPALQIGTPVNTALYDAVSSVAKYSINYTPVTQSNFSNVIKVVSSAPFINHVSAASAPTVTWRVNGGPVRDSLTLLSYRLEGVNQNCRLPGILRLDGETNGVRNYSTGHQNSTSNGGATECWLWIDFIE